MTTLNSMSTVEPVHRLQQRLNEPQTADALNQLLDNADLLALSVTALDGFLRRSDTIVDGLAESIADARATTPKFNGNLGEMLGQLLQQLPQLLELTSQLSALASSPEFQRMMAILSKPETLNAISQLMGNMELVAFLVSSIDGFLQRSETVADNLSASLEDARQTISAGDLDVDGLVQSLPQLAEAAPQLIAALPQLVTMLDKVQPLLDSGALDNLLDSGMLEPKTLDIIGQTAGALTQTVNGPSGEVKPMGTFGLLRTMNDPDVQKSLGFLMKFASNFGQKLD